jgi:outer membrane protein TolC
MKLKQVELARRARELTEEKLRIEKEKLKAGRTTNFEVLTFQNDVIAARNNELYAIIAYENAVTNLDRVLGTTLKTWNITVEPKRK